MGTRLYAANFPYDVDEDQIRAFFSGNVKQRRHGRVESVKMILDRVTGRFRGFIFVEMSTEADARAAVADLHGKSCGGRTITVEIAKDREGDKRSRERHDNE